MKAIVFDRYGTADDLHLRDVAQPVPTDDEVLVGVRAVSINDWDWGILQGVPFSNRVTFGLRTPNRHILGSDVAGRVEAVGGKVQGLRPGDSVVGDLSGRWGGFAEYVCARQDALVAMPPGMTFVEAAAIPQAATLALQGLRDRGRIQRGQRILINGAGGGVGTFGVQLAKPAARHSANSLSTLPASAMARTLRAEGEHAPPVTCARRLDVTHRSRNMPCRGHFRRGTIIRWVPPRTQPNDRLTAVSCPRGRWSRPWPGTCSPLRGPACSTCAELLVTAATLHDIGYSARIAHTGFHPLDGGAFLRAERYPERLARLVAHHSLAILTAPAHGIADLAERFPREDGLLADALAYADMHSAPDGQLIDPERRLADIAARHPDREHTARAHHLRAAISRVETALLAVVPGSRATVVRVPPPRLDRARIRALLRSTSPTG
ncbi:MAG: alcohol dehydrogenase catalytic domain-containing protein [Candidatus Nanopelagicales bacterium]